MDYTASSGCSSMLIMIIIAFFFLLCSSTASAAVVGNGRCIERERRALLAIKQDIYQPPPAADDKLNWFSSWTTTADCCTWRGVVCDNETNHVTKLDLRYPFQYETDFWMFGTRIGKYFPGPSKLNPSLLDLMHLNYLDLSMNNFSGSPIPQFIGSLVKLEYLNLSQASFGGTIPPQIGNLSNLRFLDLTTDYLYVPYFVGYTLGVGEDLGWLSHFPFLEYLDMSGVNFSMVSDHWIHQVNMLHSLSVLILSDVGLDVGISTNLDHQNFTSLTVLDLSNSQFEAMPNWLLNLSSLVHLNLEGCFLQPNAQFLDTLVSLGHLRYLNLALNSITGKFSKAFENLTELEILNLSYNDLDGSIPKTIGNLIQLQELDLSGNIMMMGELPETIGNLIRLQKLDLSGSNISGELPETIENLIRLQSLHLSDNMITGELPNSIGNLIHLQTLDLSLNMITGKLPNSIGNLIHLQALYLSRNMITGELPNSLGNLIHLQQLDLSINMISEELPNTIGNLVELQKLDLSSNMITGELPNTVGNLGNLQVLDLHSNNIDGQLPAAAIGSLCNLDTLDLSNNSIGGEVTALIDSLSQRIQNMKCNNESDQNIIETLILSQNNFNGTIPESLGQLSSLYLLDLSSNSFTGRLTEAHFSNLSNLDELDLSYNRVEVIFNQNWVPPFHAGNILMCSCHLGPKFPAWLQTQTNLVELCVSEARISDNIPSWLGDLTNMKNLNASHNQMRGQLPPSLHQLQTLDLSYNFFDGHIPSHFITDQGLFFLSLSHNRLGGTIPLDLLAYLEVLDLSYNNFSGPLPLYQNNQSQLKILDLSNNNLSGQIPAAIGSYTLLQSLHLEKNNLTGEIPSALQHCDRLVVLDIGENGLTGNIPDWIGEFLFRLRVLRLRDNFFCGNIPDRLSNLTQLQVLDLAHNNLSSILPSSFGSFKAMSTVMPKTDDLNSTSFDYTESIIINTKGGAYEYSSILSLVLSIDLSGNSIYGEIPEELTHLLGLDFLNLSRNHFTGKIPKNIGAMKQLQSLDLSVNNLSGTIPSGMSSLDFLGSLDLSQNNLSGKIPSGGHLQTFQNTSYIGNLALCGSPLPLCPGDELPQVPSHAEDEDEREDKIEIIGICISIALGFITGFWGIMITLRITHFRLTDNIYDYVYVKFAIYFARVKYMIVNDNR